VVPRGLDQQPAHVRVPGLGDRTLGAGRPRGGLSGHQADEGPDGPPGEPVPVPDLHRQCQPREIPDSPQAAQTAYQRGEFRACGQLLDRVIEPVPPRGDGQHRVVVGIEGHPDGRTCSGRQLGEGLGAEPQVVLSGPRATAGVHDPMTQQQFGQSVTGTGEVSAGVLPGPHQIPGGLLIHGRDHHRGDLPDAQQPREQERVLGIGLDPVPRGTVKLGRSHHLAPDARRPQMTAQPEPGRTSLVGHRHRSGQISQPGRDVVKGWRQTGLEQLARDTIDRRRDDRPRVHVKPNTRTLGKHRGLPQLSDRPSRQPLLGNPRIL